IREQRRWNAYVDALRQQPGIAVIRAERHGSGGFITGLKDPKAHEPENLLSFGLDPAKVRYQWQPYLSLNTPLAAERELEADLSRIRTQSVRFELGSAKLPLAEAPVVEDLAAAINRVHQARPTARLSITGHTDEVGNTEANLQLSRDRATVVAQALAAQGIP